MVKSHRNMNAIMRLLKVRAGLVSIVLIMGISVWASLTALRTVRAYSEYPPDYDEAAHLLPALQISYDLKLLRLADFLSHTYTQDRIALYPFLHSWLLAPFF